MWTVIQATCGKFRCENQNHDTTDHTWDTEAAATEWATQANAANARRLADNQARAAARRATRAGIVTAADMLIDNNAH